MSVFSSCDGRFRSEKVKQSDFIALKCLFTLESGGFFGYSYTP